MMSPRRVVIRELAVSMLLARTISGEGEWAKIQTIRTLICSIYTPFLL
jgi:hypothetical protein